ncbi:MAG TPA: M4 family metallopeptidase [Vicinamibacterales bacterium]|nr:M4 family metallopeptidase [Vicinamibacterales bacterium]HJN46643.1 M4 family metallopeptidase [Vicinamibacterales bacterium]
MQGVGATSGLQFERIFFNVWTNLLPSFATFSVAADCLIQSAVELYGPTHPATAAIAQAIAAVGIPNTATCHDTEACR